MPVTWNSNLKCSKNAVWYYVTEKYMNCVNVRGFKIRLQTKLKLLHTIPVFIQKNTKVKK